MPQKYEFEMKWKEDLYCKAKEGTLIFEITMGVYHVYFPTESKWNKDAPEWARHQYANVLTELRAWCEEKNIPLSLVDNGSIGVLK